MKKKKIPIGKSNRIAWQGQVETIAYRFRRSWRTVERRRTRDPLSLLKSSRAQSEDASAFYLSLITHAPWEIDVDPALHIAANVRNADGLMTLKSYRTFRQTDFPAARLSPIDDAAIAMISARRRCSLGMGKVSRGITLYSPHSGALGYVKNGSPFLGIRRRERQILARRHRDAVDAGRGPSG